MRTVQIFFFFFFSVRDSAIFSAVHQHSIVIYFLSASGDEFSLFYLITNRFVNLTRLMPTLLNVVAIHTHPHIQGRDRGGWRRGEEAQKTHKSCRRHTGNGGDLSGKRKKCRQERVDSVATNPDNLENRKEAGGEHKVLRAQVRNVQVERVCPLCRVLSLIEVFVTNALF